MTLLKDNNYKEINVALLSLEADIKNKITNFDTSVIDRQLVEINSRIDKINAGDNNTSAQINDIRYEIEDINYKLKVNSDKIENIEQKLSDIFSAENKVTDFNTTTDSGIYYWLTDAANKPGTDYGVLLVNKYDRGDNNSIWINQIAYGTNNKIYFRQNINSGNWTEWKAVAFEGELNADTVDNYHASDLWRSDGATWNPKANVVMTPTANGDEWSFDFRNKNDKTGCYWQVWDENKYTLLQVNADDGKVSAPYGFVIGSSNATGSKLTIQGSTVNSNSYTDTNPKLEFKNSDGSQNISLTFNDFDAVQEPASLTLNGNQGNEYFIAPNIKATTKFTGNLIGNVTGNVSGSSGSCTGNSATANNGFNSSTVTNSTPSWGYLTSGNGYSNGRTYSFANGGGIATAEKDTKSSLQVDGDLYVHEGLDKVATLNDIPKSLPANGGTASTATNADYATRLKPFAYWDYQYEYDETNGIRVFVYKITMPSDFNSILVQIYDDINYERCRKYILGLWRHSDFAYNVSVTDLGGTISNGLCVWLGNDGNVYLQADAYWKSRITFSYLDDYTDVTIEKIGSAKYGSNKDIDGTVLFTPLGDPITDCGAIRGASDLSSASKVPQYLKADILFASSKLEASSKMIIPIGAPSLLEDGCIWIER